MPVKTLPEAGAATSLTDAIGNTPLVELSRFSAGAARIFAKLEWFNPGGSVKDRIARAMIADAERSGLLRSGGTIVEPTSGNTGVALAMLAAAKGYGCILVMPEGYGEVKAKLMQALGARVVRTPADLRMRGAIERAQQIARETTGAFLPNQFSNPANPQAHFETTGPEIAAAAPELVDAFVAGVGTTGTFTGTARFLRTRYPSLWRTAVEPRGSILGGGEAGPHAVEGIGLSFFPDILDRSVIDEVLTISDEEAFETCRTVARTEGLLIAGSSGAAAAGALRVATRLGPGKVVVTIFPDGAERYPNQGIFERSG